MVVCQGEEGNASAVAAGRQMIVTMLGGVVLSCPSPLPALNLSWLLRPCSLAFLLFASVLAPPSSHFANITCCSGCPSSLYSYFSHMLFVVLLSLYRQSSHRRVNPSSISIFICMHSYPIEPVLLALVTITLRVCFCLHSLVCDTHTLQRGNGAFSIAKFRMEAVPTDAWQVGTRCTVCNQVPSRAQ